MKTAVFEDAVLCVRVERLSKATYMLNRDSLLEWNGKSQEVMELRLGTFCEI
jgi:hypothetical protein